MVSRRKILSRSIDDVCLLDEGDVWLNKDKLYQDHIQEILQKWPQIDDEIWGKVISMERNRRVAKAYARAQVITVDGSSDGFDGFRIGLRGFENPMRDPQTEKQVQKLNEGFKMKIDDDGNILIKNLSKCCITALCSPLDMDPKTGTPKQPEKVLEVNKPTKLFDMKMYRQNISQEMQRSYPDRRKLEHQCISIVVIGKRECNLLTTPCWIMVVNIVAMEMLKSKLLPPASRPLHRASLFPRPPDEDPYSVAGSNFYPDHRKDDKQSDSPPQLPPRDIVSSSKQSGRKSSQTKLTVHSLKSRLSSHFSKKKEKEYGEERPPEQNGLHSSIQR